MVQARSPSVDSNGFLGSRLRIGPARLAQNSMKHRGMRTLDTTYMRQEQHGLNIVTSGRKSSGGNPIGGGRLATPLNQE